MKKIFHTYSQYESHYYPKKIEEIDWSLPPEELGKVLAKHIMKEVSSCDDTKLCILDVGPELPEKYRCDDTKLCILDVGPKKL